MIHCRRRTGKKKCEFLLREENWGHFERNYHNKQDESKKAD